MIQVLYSGKTTPTAVAIRQELLARGVQSVECWRKDLPPVTTAPEKVLRVNWGRALTEVDQGILYLNRAAPRRKTDALREMKRWGVRLPPFIIGDKLIIRGDMTRAGQKMRVFEDSFCTAYVPKSYELRADVFDGKVFRLHVKTGDPEVVAWNRGDSVSWSTFGGLAMVRKAIEAFPELRESVIREAIDQAKTAIDALSYDFGAVDMVVGPSDEENTEGDVVFVLEVNSAPSLFATGSGLSRYCHRILRTYEGLSGYHECSR